MEQILYLKTLIVSPGNIFIALLDNPLLPVQNPYPYLTLYTAGLKAKDSSEVVSLSMNGNP